MLCKLIAYTIYIVRYFLSPLAFSDRDQEEQLLLLITKIHYVADGFYHFISMNVVLDE